MAEEDNEMVEVVSSDEDVLKFLAGLKEEVQRMVSTGNSVGALRQAIKSPPATKNDDIKKQAADVVNTAFQGVPGDAIDKFIGECSDDERAIIMSYVYKCMANSTKNQCDTLLKWHAKVRSA